MNKKPLQKHYKIITHHEGSSAIRKNNDNHELYEIFTGSASHLARHLKTIRVLIIH